MLQPPGKVVNGRDTAVLRKTDDHSASITVTVLGAEVAAAVIRDFIAPLEPVLAPGTSFYGASDPNRKRLAFAVGEFVAVLVEGADAIDRTVLVAVARGITGQPTDGPMQQVNPNRKT